MLSCWKTEFGRHAWWRTHLSGACWVTDKMQLEAQCKKRERERRGRLVSFSCPQVFGQCLPLANPIQEAREQWSLGSVVLWDTEQSTEGEGMHSTEYNFIKFVLTRKHTTTIYNLKSLWNALLFLLPSRPSTMKFHLRYFLCQILSKEFM